MDSLPTELMLLVFGIILLFVQIALFGHLATRERGMGWNAGPRDGEAKPLGLYAGRADRTLRNFQETFPVYIALALGLAVSGRTGGAGEIGAWLWFLARIVYIPLYLFGVPYLRSLAWLASILGLVLMMIRFF